MVSSYWKNDPPSIKKMKKIAATWVWSLEDEIVSWASECYIYSIEDDAWLDMDDASEDEVVNQKEHCNCYYKNDGSIPDTKCEIHGENMYKQWRFTGIDSDHEFDGVFCGN